MLFDAHPSSAFSGQCPMKPFVRWVSILAHPFSMITLLVAVPAVDQPSGPAVQSVLIVVLVVIVPIAILMLRQVRRGRWSNVDASNPSERPILLVIALASLLALIGWLRLNDPKSFLVHGMFVVFLFLLVAALLTRWIKLSLHVAFSTLSATTLSLMGSWIGYAVIAVVPVVFWSRLVLARHRVHELVFGLVLGALTGFALVNL